jgi:NTE family protein
VLERDYEQTLRVSLASPTNLLRLLSGGLNDRTHLPTMLNREVFKGATFADLHRARKPDIWINATDLFNRSPFPFIPPVFEGLCSDLLTLPLADAVAASMAVPLAFAPVVLKTFPQACTSGIPPWVPLAANSEAASVTSELATSTARAIQRYRNPAQLRYVKLADGGLTDNQGLASILIARAVAGNAHGPLTEADAIRLRRMLFLIVDAGRPSSGDWALVPAGPSGVDVAIAAVDAAIDSATRLSAAAFRTMYEDWRRSIVAFRCSLPLERVRRVLPPEAPWDCEDVRFYLDVLGFERLPAEQAERLRQMPTRLALGAQDLDLAVAAGQQALKASPMLKRYLEERATR